MGKSILKLRNVFFGAFALVLVFMFNNCGRFATTEQWSSTALNQNSQNGLDDDSVGKTPSPNTNPSPQPQTQQPQPMPQTRGKIGTIEPAGMTKLLDCPFTNSICGMWDNYKSATFTQLGINNALPASPTMALDNWMGVNGVTGGGEIGYVLDNVKEVYIATYWSTNSDFVGMCNNTNKMFFVRRPDVDNNFLVWQGAPVYGQAKVLKWYNQATYDNCGHAGEYGMCYTKGDGTGWFEPNGESNGSVLPGSGWHLIEVYMKASSSKTSRDGIMRWALDGKVVGNYPNVNLSPGGFQDFQYNHTWDGTGCLLVRDKSKEWHHYWDHLYISVR